MSKIVIATDQSFTTEVLRADTPVVVDYWADWCGPCKQLAPIVDELAEQYDGRIKFVKVDTNTETATAARQDVRMLPTIQMFVQGQMVDTIIGAVPKMKLRQAIENLV